MFANRLTKPLGRSLAAVTLGISVLAATACNEHDHSGHGHADHKKPAAPSGPAAAPAAADYPLKTCVVSGEKLGSHGEPYDHKHEGRLVRFCCEGCIDDFNEDPAKYLAKIDQATAAQAGGDTK